MELSVTHAFLVASLLLLLYLFSSPRKDLYGHGHLKSIPSPPALPVIGHLHLLGKPLHRSLSALAARYGCGRGGVGLLSLRFGARPVLLVSSAAIAEECFTVHDVALADRPGLASRRLLTDECPSIALSNYGPLWRDLRRIVTVHALSAHRLSLTSSVRAIEIRAMAKRLYERAGAGAGAGAGATPVSVRATAYEFVVNVIMAMVSGRRMAEEDVRWFMALTEAGLAAAGSANRQDFLPVLRLLDFGRTRRSLVGIAKERRDFGQRLIDEYRRLNPRGEETPSAPRTLLGDVLRQQERSPESYPDLVIRTLCMSMLQAGADTSSSAIEWAMALLLNNPDVLAKAKAEIGVVVGTSRLIQESDLEVLPYLRCIIIETLRLYPLAPNLIPHEASRDCIITSCQYVIERGTMVLVDVYSIQRDPASWNDPDMFIPERFMSGNVFGGQGGKRMMMPFGMGRRKCPGEGFAWRTVGVALAGMLQCFEWGRVGDKVVDMSEGSGLTMHMSVPLVAVCRSRQDMDAMLKSL